MEILAVIRSLKAFRHYSGNLLLFIRFLGLGEPGGIVERLDMPGKALPGALYKSKTKLSLVGVRPNIVNSWVF